VKWFFLNAKRRLQHAFSNPRYAATIVLREATWADERFLAIVTGSSAWRIRKFLDEPVHSRQFTQHLSGSEGKLHTAPFQSADLYAKKVLIQYAIIRAMRPDVVVETGIANGVSSAYVLLALKKNGNGVLHSIEIGDTSYLPANCEPGWIVPSWLRAPWKVHVGDSTKLLPELLRTLPPIDVFIHDSLHTAEQMTVEFETAYPFLRPDGCLIADDALWNEAFRQFADARRLRDAQIIRGIGVAAK
jgi:predicted O-methyltransferase YrrM